MFDVNYCSNAIIENVIEDKVRISKNILDSINHINSNYLLIQNKLNGYKHGFEQQ